MHKYNNQDHAMMTAMLAVENIVSGTRRFDIWNVNEDAEYHEEEGPTTSSRPSRTCGWCRSGRRRPERRSPPRQNASAGSSIVLAAPAWMRARWVAVSGNMRSTKKRPVTSLALMRSPAPLAPAASLPWAASAMRAHM